MSATQTVFGAAAEKLRSSKLGAIGRQCKLMTIDAGEFIRRFLLHVLPDGFHRIRHYGFLANGVRVAAIARVRAALEAVPPEHPAPATDAYAAPCPCCGGRMIIIERFERGAASPHASPTFRIDSS